MLHVRMYVTWCKFMYTHGKLTTTAMTCSDLTVPVDEAAEYGVGRTNVNHLGGLDAENKSATGTGGICSRFSIFKLVVTVDRPPHGTHTFADLLDLSLPASSLPRWAQSAT